MTPMNIRQKLRASHVKRWHIVETSKQQTVAEHSFNVYLLVRHMFDMFSDDQWLWLFAWKNAAGIYALHHDLPEIVMGDIPTPSKVTFVDPLQLDAVDMKLCPELQRISTAPPEVHVIIKIADYIDAVNFLNMHGVGTHATNVKGTITYKANEWLRNCDIDGTIKGELIGFMESAFLWNTPFDGDNDDGYSNF